MENRTKGRKPKLSEADKVKQKKVYITDKEEKKIIKLHGDLTKALRSTIL